MHSSGVHHLLSLEMLKKHFCLEANITNTNNVLDQPEKPASGRGIIMKDGGRGEGRRESFIYTQEDGNGPSLIALIWPVWRNMPGKLSFARAEQMFELTGVGRRGQTPPSTEADPE